MKTDKMWSKTEISSRNCYNCLTDGEIVGCRKGHSLESPVIINIRRGVSVYKPLERQAVEHYARLFHCCKNCLDFDGVWD